MLRAVSLRSVQVINLPTDKLVAPPRPKRYWQTSDFWKDAGERIVTAFLEGVTGVIGLDQVITLLGGRFDMAWWHPMVAAGIMAVLSTVKAIIGAKRSDTTTPVSIL